MPQCSDALKYDTCLACSRAVATKSLAKDCDRLAANVTPMVNFNPDNYSWGPNMRNDQIDDRANEVKGKVKSAFGKAQGSRCTIGAAFGAKLFGNARGY